jgi:acetyl esterase/lipase
MFDALHITKASGVTLFAAIEFAVVDGYRPLQLDVYLPPGAAEAETSSYPAILFIHGGGWAVGSRRRFGRAFRDWAPTPLERLATAGFVVACVDYRLSGEARFPAQLDDCKAAVRWLRANSAALRVDPDMIVSWGESAGGHLALLVGLTGNRADMDGTVGEHTNMRSDVCAVVDWYGITDLVNIAAQRHPTSATDYDSADCYESRLLGAPIAGRPDAALVASPITYVHRDAPPVQIHHGDADRMVPYAQSESMVRALIELEVPVEFVTLPGADHFWIGAPDINAIFEASLAFANHATRGVSKNATGS